MPSLTLLPISRVKAVALWLGALVPAMAIALAIAGVAGPAPRVARAPRRAAGAAGGGSAAIAAVARSNTVRTAARRTGSGMPRTAETKSANSDATGMPAPLVAAGSEAATLPRRASIG